MAEGGPSSAIEFVGRAKELATVRAVVERAREGQAGALLIQGGAGVGKTELVAQLLREAGAHAMVVRGAALPLTSMTVPYLPLRAALARLAPGAGEEHVAVFDGAEPVDGVPLAFDRWVSAQCRDRLLVLAIDDLHWADLSTLDALMYLLSGSADRRLAVLLTLRHGEIREGHRLHRWLADVRRLPGFQVMTLGPFDRATTEAQIAGLLGAPPHQSLVDDVVARTGGNAYLTRLLVAGLSPEVRWLPDALPGDLEGALLASWHQLSDPARDLTKVVAIGGRRVSTAELAKFLAGEDAFGDVTGLLREAETASVLDLGPDGGYWFHHPLQAQVLERRVPPEERRSWHARFAAHFEGLLDPAAPVDVELLAAVADHHHLAGHAGEAYGWARRAAAAAGTWGGTREQIRLLRRALELRDHAVQAPPRVALLLEVRDVAVRVGDHEGELDTIEELLAEISDAADPLLRAELLVREGHLRFAIGRAFPSPEDVERAVELSSRDPDSWQHAYSLAEMARVCMWAEDPRSADVAEQAIAVARRTGHPRALSYALTAGAIMAVCAGRDEGLVLADEARRAAIEAEDYWAYVHATSWEMNSIGPFTSEQGTAHVSRRRRELQTLAAPHFYVAWLAAIEASGWVSQGQWALAAEPLRIALGANPGGLADVSTRLAAARLAAFQGRMGEALAHMQRADELCGDSSVFLPLESDVVRSEVLLAAGDPQGAFASAIRGATLPGAPPTLCERLIPLAARSLADLVEDTRARGSDVGPLLDRVDDLARQFPEVIADFYPDQPDYHAQLAACSAWYAAELGRARRDPDNATAWEQVVRLARAAVMPWDAAYAGLHAARAHLSAGPGHRQGAAESLRAAHRLAEELRAGPVLDALDQLATAARLPLDDIEPGQPDAAGHQLPGLTPREGEVLAHIVGGRTYSEIARALVVSEKTVSTHVSNMLRKYGLANRIELAQLATHQTTPEQRTSKERNRQQ